MIGLAAVGALAETKTFTLPLNPKAVEKIIDLPERILRSIKPALAELEARNENQELQRALKVTIKNFEQPGFFKEFKQTLRDLDQALTFGQILRLVRIIKERLLNLK